MKRLTLLLSIITVIVIVIPSLLVAAFSPDESDHHNQIDPAQPIGMITSSFDVPVYRTALNKIESIPVEDYVVGVVASEMPAEFEIEALKAQALAARTYIVKQMLQPTEMTLPENAVVTDTIHHQVYKNHEELQQLWGSDYEWKYVRIAKAVEETKGKIITYHNEPITAQFFSTSNGYTENAEDYWQNELPYLKSVESPWDTASPKFTATHEISVDSFEEKLDVSLPDDGSIGTIVERTESNRVREVEIAGKRLTGREVRENLELNSSDFNWERNGDTIRIHTKGYGHGVGMSQYGANGMALEGMSAEEIISHYYNDVEVTNMSSYVAQLTD